MEGWSNFCAFTGLLKPYQILFYNVNLFEHLSVQSLSVWVAEKGTAIGTLGGQGSSQLFYFCVWIAAILNTEIPASAAAGYNSLNTLFHTELAQTHWQSNC